MLVFPRLIDSKSYKVSSLEHHTSPITHHISHIAYEFEALQNISETNSVAFQQLITTDLKYGLPNIFGEKSLHLQYKCVCRIQNLVDQIFCGENRPFLKILDFRQILK